MTLGKLQKYFFKPVSARSMGVLRIAFGVIMLFEVFRYFDHNWINSYWVDPEYNFTYWPFDFVKPFAQPYLDYFFIALGVLAVFIALGIFYRIAVTLFFFGFSYVFLLEQTRYLNHFYLIVLISAVLIFIDADRSYSLRNIWRKSHNMVPQWQLWMMQFMLALPYFWGGVAKLNMDWLRGEPLGAWLQNDTDLAIIGPLFTEQWFILFFSYAGLLLDLLLVPALLFRKTRYYAFAAACSFHLLNDQIFTIGIFPWFMLFATTIFFHPDWPKDVLSKLKVKTMEGESLPYFRPKRMVVFMLVGWAGLHCFLPLRHLLYPGNVNWTEEGHRFAWHMKLRSKSARGFFEVVDRNSGSVRNIDPEEILESWQSKKMMGQPPLIWQFAQFLEAQFKENGFEVAVYAHIDARVNNRSYQQFIDPSVDLTQVERPLFAPTSWIIPLHQPLRNRWDAD